MQARLAGAAPRAPAHAEPQRHHTGTHERHRAGPAGVLENEAREDEPAGGRVGHRLAALPGRGAEVGGRWRARDERQDEATDSHREAKEDALLHEQPAEPHHPGGPGRQRRDEDQRATDQAMERAERDQDEGRRRTAARLPGNEAPQGEQEKQRDQSAVGDLRERPAFDDRGRRREAEPGCREGDLAHRRGFRARPTGNGSPEEAEREGHHEALHLHEPMHLAGVRGRRAGRVEEPVANADPGEHHAEREEEPERLGTPSSNHAATGVQEHDPSASAGEGGGFPKTRIPATSRAALRKRSRPCRGRAGGGPRHARCSPDGWGPGRREGPREV